MLIEYANRKQSFLKGHFSQLRRLSPAASKHRRIRKNVCKQKTKNNAVVCFQVKLSSSHNFIRCCRSLLTKILRGTYTFLPSGNYGSPDGAFRYDIWCMTKMQDEFSLYLGMEALNFFLSFLQREQQFVPNYLFDQSFFLFSLQKAQKWVFT